MLRLVLQKPGSVGQGTLTQTLLNQRACKGGFVPLNITGVTPSLPEITSPMYPVSSLSSLMAHVSGDSPGSMRPAGTSMQILSIGGRYCFCRRSSGPDSRSIIAHMPTPSTRLPLGLVERTALSQSLVYVHVRREQTHLSGEMAARPYCRQRCM